MNRAKIRLFGLATIVFSMLANILFVGWFVTGQVSADSLTNHHSISNHTGQSCTQPAVTSTDLLAIYVLAFDNDPIVTNKFNLSKNYAGTVNGIAAATAIDPDKRAVILADLDSDGDTHILTVANGSVNTVDCLPDSAGNLRDSITEYNSADGATLGGFLLWAIETYPANQTIFSYIGHGSAFAPDAGQPISNLVTDPNSRATLSPLPIKLDANPLFTDHHLPGQTGQAIVTPHDISTALSIATDGGNNPIDVVDLAHCFAASIEELYELQPYSAVTTGSPNYTFFGSTMPGLALQNVSVGDSAPMMSEAILQAYENEIQANNAAIHPYVLLTLDNSKLPNVKEDWDEVSNELLRHLKEDELLTISRVQAAYQASAKYDTTFCEEEPELDLAPPDALSDMADFVRELQTQFVGTSVDPLLSNVLMSIEASISTSQFLANGSPHFFEGDGPAPTWTFSEEPFFSLFTPFETWESDSGDNYHTWQSLWYSTSTSYELNMSVTISNPHPLRFVQADTGVGWADFLAAYWRVVGERPGADVNTAFCTAPLQPIFPGRTQMESTLDDSADPIETGKYFDYNISVTNDGETTATELLTFLTLPAEVQFSHAPENCGLYGDEVICQREDLDSGETDTFRIQVRALQPGVPNAILKTEAAQADSATMATESTQIIGVPLAVDGIQIDVDGRPAIGFILFVLSISFGLAGFTMVTRRSVR